MTSRLRQDSDKQTGMLDDFEDFFNKGKSRFSYNTGETKTSATFPVLPQNTLMLTESHGEFSDLPSIFRLRALRYQPNETKKLQSLAMRTKEAHINKDESNRRFKEVQSNVD